MMNISQVIKKLQIIEQQEGDLPVVITADHEHWGILYYNIADSTIYIDEHAQPNGPKSGTSIRAVVIGNDF
jgi:hypothetical protein